MILFNIVPQTFSGYGKKRKNLNFVIIQCTKNENILQVFLYNEPGRKWPGWRKNFIMRYFSYLELYHLFFVYLSNVLSEKVPIPDKLLPFYQEWYDRHPECEYLLRTPDGKHFLYRNYKDSYYTTIMEQIGIKWSPHCNLHNERTQNSTTLSGHPIKIQG